RRDPGVRARGARLPASDLTPTANSVFPVAWVRRGLGFSSRAMRSTSSLAGRESTFVGGAAGGGSGADGRIVVALTGDGVARSGWISRGLGSGGRSGSGGDPKEGRRAASSSLRIRSYWDELTR